MVKSTKQAAFKRGIRAETYAAWYLRFKGFRIVVRRYKTRYGEIDLIARRGNLVLIVEVKARDSLQQAMEALGRLSEQRIEAAADYWLSRQHSYEKLSLRFDLIAIIPKRWPVHIPACFSSRIGNL